MAKVFATLTGTLPAGSIKLEYSFDAGATWTTLPREQITSGATGANPTRLLRVTLIRVGPTAPVLRAVSETFEKTGGPGLTQLVLRFTVTDTVNTRWLFIDSDGVVTLELAIAQSTPTKALLTKIVPNGVLAPTVKDYRNKRYYISPGIGEVFGSQGWISAQQFSFTRSQTPCLLQQPDGNACADNARVSANYAGQTFNSRESVSEITHKPLQELGLFGSCHL